MRNSILRRVAMGCLGLFYCMGVWAKAEGADSAKVRHQLHFVSVRTQAGAVLPTSEFLTEPGVRRHFAALALRYGLESKGTRWQDKVYGNPYWGIGAQISTFRRAKELGNPLTLYLFQGAEIHRFSRNLSLGYEWNLGGSGDWRPYDPIDNPENTVMGAPWAIYVCLGPTLDWRVTRGLSVMVGMQFSHYSNGGTSLPNQGINMFSPSVTLRYTIDRKPLEEVERAMNATVVPAFMAHWEHDLYLTSSSRQVEFDPAETGLPMQYVDYSFNVVGVTYGLNRVPNHRFRYGAALSLTYDSSAKARVWQEGEYRRVKLAPAYQSVSVGVALHGELVTERLSLFLDVGYNLYNAQKKDPSLYQVLGMKIALQENLFGTFGVKAGYFSRAQYLYWSLGYTIR